MKLQLDNRTLNAYINEALRRELNENSMDELFGSRVRKQSQRMITGQGWGNQKRETGNLWGAANTAIDVNADAESDTPQTLVGMIGKLENALKTAEQVAGIQSPNGNLMATVTTSKGVKGSLLAAINALTQIANRLNAVEAKSGSNSIMESAGDYADAAIGGSAAAGNAWTSSLKNTERALKNGGFQLNNGNWTHMYDASHNALNSPHKEMQVAANNYKNITGKTGFWQRQAAKQGGNMKTAWQGLKDSAHMVTHPNDAVTWANGAKNMKAAVKGVNAGKNIGKVGAVARAGKQALDMTARLTQWPMMLLSIADEAARQAAQGRQRNIVRTYNAAAVIARRMANIMQEIENAQQTNQSASPLEESVKEINVHRGMKSFDSIKNGMRELSGLMKQIGDSTQGSTRNRVVQIPEGLDLNTREGVLAFQEWANSVPITDANGAALKEDGIFGENTEFVYDKIAQMLQQGQTQPALEEGLIKESKAIEHALANLERAAGSTGSGGNAYSDIDAMSGGADASRLQNAQNIKNIIRTYPPVLNQYLTILSNAGADVSAMQPLVVDTRPHRNYSVKELQAIDTRIQELLGIARNMDIPEGQDGQGGVIIRGTLPPKPVRQPQPQPKPQPEPPVPELPELEMPEIEDEPLDLDDNITMNLDSSLPEIPFMVNPYSLQAYGIIPNDKAGRITKRELKQKINQAMADGRLTPERAQELIQKVVTDYKNGVAQQYTNPDGSVAYTTHKAQRAAKRRGETNLNTPIQQPATVPMNEQAFKKLVKQIIRESLRKR